MRRSSLLLSFGISVLCAGTAVGQNNTPHNLILFIPDGLRGQIVYAPDRAGHGGCP